MESNKNAENDVNCMGVGGALSEHGEVRSSTLQVSQSDAERELAKFLTLAEELGPGLGIFSSYIDNFWKELTADHEAYVDFCSSNGVKVWKRESNDDDVVELIKWVSEYGIRWGFLSPAWFADDEGIVSAAVYWSFLESREVCAVPKSFVRVSEV